MEIQVNTDSHVDGDELLIAFVQERVTEILEPYAGRIVSAQVHLRGETGGGRRPTTLTCVLEVRPVGHSPVAVRRRGATKDEVIRDAGNGMRELLDRLFGRLESRHPGAPSIRQPG